MLFTKQKPYYGDPWCSYLSDTSTLPHGLSTFCSDCMGGYVCVCGSVCGWWLTAFSVSIAIAFWAHNRGGGRAAMSPGPGPGPSRGTGPEPRQRKGASSYLYLTLGQRVAIYAFPILIFQRAPSLPLLWPALFVQCVCVLNSEWID